MHKRKWGPFTAAMNVGPQKKTMPLISQGWYGKLYDFLVTDYLDLCAIWICTESEATLPSEKWQV